MDIVDFTDETLAVLRRRAVDATAREDVTTAILLLILHHLQRIDEELIAFRRFVEQR